MKDRSKHTSECPAYLDGGDGLHAVCEDAVAGCEDPVVEIEDAESGGGCRDGEEDIEDVEPFACHPGGRGWVILLSEAVLDAFVGRVSLTSAALM